MREHASVESVQLERVLRQMSGRQLSERQDELREVQARLQDVWTDSRNMYIVLA